ncbi:putative L-carnitine dehydratase [Streptomyces litmocidini]|uniref:CoA transferase n=1 Tax=Streptomyces litmocidini TaxID=67318 RepID=UPI00167D706D|nr:CoA transferase [Streptomyces litmocidini]GGU88202.1 putative L-carnitine dehydratase [Streptomyces litmocidini]
MDNTVRTGTESLWSALGGDPALVDRVEYGGVSGLLPARLPVMDLARAAVAVCSLAAVEHAGLPGPVRVDDGAVATAFVSERHLRVDGRTPVNFAPLSRFWRAADGWVRTHANYPHHEAALLAALGVPDSASGPGSGSVEAVAAAIGGRRAVEVETAVYAAGGLAVALRTPGEWAASEQGREVAARPLLTRERLDEAAPRAGNGRPPRVLDLTRVIAGPVATRTLALLGADVLRIDPPGNPELPDQHADADVGKRTAALDLDRPSDRRTFDELLDSADVLVTGYRPGALDRFDLERPGLVTARLSAWGDYGPWGGRRGFDSLVQVATGIAAVEGSAEEPGALPAQALDHGTGYLLAAAVLRSLTEQRTEGGSRLVRLALAQTGHWLTDSLPRYSPERYLAESEGPLGRLRHSLSPVSYEGGPANWSRPPGLAGADAAEWDGG